MKKGLTTRIIMAVIGTVLVIGCMCMPISVRAAAKVSAAKTAKTKKAAKTAKNAKSAKKSKTGAKKSKKGTKKKRVVKKERLDTNPPLIDPENPPGGVSAY